MFYLKASLYQGKEPTEEETENCHKSLKLIDGLIGGRKYVAGDELTIADISIAHTISLLVCNDFKDLELFTNLKVWYNNIKEESNYLKESSEIARAEYEKILAKRQNAA